MSEPSATPLPGVQAPLLGPGAGLAAYGMLLLGFLLLGFAAQGLHLLGGLWISEALAIALPALVFLRAANVRAGPLLGLRLPAGHWWLLAILLPVLNQPAVTLLEHAAHSGLPAPMVRAFDAKIDFLMAVFRQQAVPMLITVTLAAPLGEELFFRGFLQPALASRWGQAAAVVVGGALFSLIHLDPIGFVGLWEIGILFALLRHASGSLWPAVLAHAVNNGVAGLSYMLDCQDPAHPTRPAFLDCADPRKAPPGWLLVLGAVLLAAGVWWAARVLRAPSPAPAREERDQPGPGADGLRLARAWPLVATWLAAVAWGATSLLQQLRGR